MPKGLKDKINWLIIALVVTAAYGLLTIWLLGWSNVASFLRSNPTSLNSVGDFTAGMFAPIAVIWLVAAVLTQRQELEEAREQSRLAQVQFADNQRVVDEQLKTIKSQNALLQMQHQQSVDNATKAYRLSLFDKRMTVYEKFMKIGEEYSDGKWDDDGYWALLNLAHEAAFVFDKDIEDWLNDMADHVYEYQQYCMANPTEKTVDALNHASEAQSEKNKEINRIRGSYENWLGEQFLPETRNEKFWPFMHISDKPYIQG